MDFRNLLWFQVILAYLYALDHCKCLHETCGFANNLSSQGELFALDVGVSSVLHNDLIMDGLQDVRTVLESDFGKAVLDVNYFASLPGPIHRKVFLC